MKKPSKWILSGTGVLFALILLFAIGYFIKARSVMKDMTPIGTLETAKGVFSVRDSFSNFYIIKDGEKYIAIDAGNKTGTIRKELQKLNIKPEQVIAVLLTHTDGDHVAGISIFTNAAIYLSKPEEQMINGEKARFFLFGNHIDAKKYTLIDDRQTMSIGGIKVQGFLAPGHTPGSMCYLVNDTLLFTGDALRLKLGKVDKFVEFLNMDSEKATQTIRKIITIPGVRYIFTAHYGFTSDVQNAVNDWE